MKGRILVVDGNYDTLVALATALRARNHHVALATDGRSVLKRKALQQLRRQRQP